MWKEYGMIMGVAEHATVINWLYTKFILII